MTGEARRRAIFFPVLFASAFVLNFCWESWHGLLYAAHQTIPAMSYVPMMVQMSLLDALSVVGMQLFTALFARALVWSPDLRSVTVFFLAGMIPAGGVEYVSVNILHAWSYTPEMPTLFRVGLSPLLQLPLTGLAGVFLSRPFSGYGRS
jgi:hypothetical protein